MLGFRAHELYGDDDYISFGIVTRRSLSGTDSPSFRPIPMNPDELVEMMLDPDATHPRPYNEGDSVDLGLDVGTLIEECDDQVSTSD